MRRSKRTSKKRIASSFIDSDDEEELETVKPKRRSTEVHHTNSQQEFKQIQESSSTSKKPGKSKNSGSSSSESDIENYLQKPDKIDFSSNFFLIKESVKVTEKKSLDDPSSDSESEHKVVSSNHSFHELNNFTKTLEETKRLVEEYEANKELKSVKIKTEKKDDEDILNLLARGEANAKSSNDVQVVHSSDSESSSESDREDWKEIENKEESKIVIPKEGIQVLVELPDPRRKKKEIELLASIKRRLNSVRKENQVLVHQVHLLCWIAHGNYLNQTLNCESVMSLLLSLIPPRFCVPPNRTNLKYLENFLKWYRDTIPIHEKETPPGVTLKNLLKLQANLKKVFAKKMLVYLFISILRSLGIPCRLVLSFQVEPLKPPSSDLHSVSTKKTEEKITDIIQIDGAGDTDDEQKSVRTRRKSKLAYVEISSDGEDFEPNKKRKGSRSAKSDSKTFEEDGDDFEQKKKRRSGSKTSEKDEEFRIQNKEKVKKRVRNKKNAPNENVGFNTWMEVFVESEDKWIGVDVINGQINCPSEIYTKASNPVTYIVGWNNDGFIKDVTQRYCSNWNTEIRKLRVDKRWWRRTMRRFAGKKTLRDRREDEELESLQLEQPLPTRISDYKNHPLYVLQRHLLKYEALYPPNPTVLGFVRKEPVYSRECVKILQPREYWYREAKVVRLGEEPYKMVKCQKFNRGKGIFDYNVPQEIFGEWQLEDFVPPAAKNGIVPKNEYGNVDLYKPSMLPKGTVQIRLPGLHKIAKKLRIDCPQAMITFDKIEWVPIFDGYIVCEEDAEILTEAWHEEQREMKKKEREKIEKRVYDNWKKLTRGLLILKKLKARYNFGETSKSDEAKVETKEKSSRFTCRKPKAGN